MSATEEHGLRCLMRLALAFQTQKPITLGEVARAEGLTVAYAAKLLGLLRKAGIVRSVRGPRGCIVLAREPERITLKEAMDALAGRAVRTGPCLDPSGIRCGQADTCGLRPVWTRVERTVGEVLGSLTLADLVREGRAPAAAPLVRRERKRARGVVGVTAEG